MRGTVIATLVVLQGAVALAEHDEELTPRPVGKLALGPLVIEKHLPKAFLQCPPQSCGRSCDDAAEEFISFFENVSSPNSGARLDVRVDCVDRAGKWVSGCPPTAQKIALIVTITLVPDKKPFERPQAKACRLPIPRDRWRTPAGVGLDDPADKVLALHGPPSLKRPMSKDGQSYALVYSREGDLENAHAITFVIKAGRVVEITVEHWT